MNTEAPQRRSGPHAPLPSAGVAAAVTQSLEATSEAAATPVRSEDDPRERAAKRAAQLRDHGSMEEGSDKFHIDPAIIPDGWSYEWRTLMVMGKEDPSYQVNLARKGWEAVPRKRHPEMMPGNFAGETILRDGMILMERPKEITDEARAREYKNARDQVRAKETQLGSAPAGQFGRDNKGDQLASVKKSYEAMPPIPDK